MKLANLDNIPLYPAVIYKDGGWLSWGDWLGTGRIAEQLKTFLPFEEAKQFVHNLNLKSVTEWREYCKGGKKPLNIPSCPDKFYKNSGWLSMKDWLGTRPGWDSDYLPFEEAKQFVHNLNIKSGTEWREYCKSGKKPDNIPSNPHCFYKNSGWVSMGDWLGTGRIADQLKVFLSFEEAKQFVYKLNLEGQKEWNEYCKSGKKPNNIPQNPAGVYKDSGWLSWGDWIGTRPGWDSDYLPFEEAKQFVHNLNLQSTKEWNGYCKNGKKPLNIPSCPNNFYKDNGWLSMGDWLGTGRIADKLKVFLPFEEAKQFVHKLNLKSGTEWREYCKSGKKPDNIPSSPWNVYKDSGWLSMGDWLGTGRIADQLKVFLSFEEAKQFVHKLNLKSVKEWNGYCKSGKRPLNIPSCPNNFYKDSGWLSWGDWLGTGRIGYKKCENLSSSTKVVVSQ